MEEPRFIFQKNADKTLNRIMIPKFFIDEFGRKFIMKVYKDKIVLEPIREEK